MAYRLGLHDAGGLAVHLEHVVGSAVQWPCFSLNSRTEKPAAGCRLTEPRLRTAHLACSSRSSIAPTRSSLATMCPRSSFSRKSSAGSQAHPNLEDSSVYRPLRPTCEGSNQSITPSGASSLVRRAAPMRNCDRLRSLPPSPKRGAGGAAPAGGTGGVPLFPKTLEGGQVGQRRRPSQSPR